MAYDIVETSRSSIDSSRKLLGLYSHLCQHIQPEQGVLSSESVCDKESLTLQRVLQRQADRTKLEVRRFLAKDGDAVDDDGDYREDENLAAEEAIWSRFAPAKSGNQQGEYDEGSGMGWGKAAARLQRGVKWLVKDLPEDSE